MFPRENYMLNNNFITFVIMKNIIKSLSLISALLMVKGNVFAQAKVDTISLENGLIKEIQYHENNNIYNIAYYDLTDKPIKVGNELEYYHDGTTIKKNLNRVAGKYDGKQEVFYENGKLKTSVTYKDDQIVDSASWDTAGNSIPYLGFTKKAKPEFNLFEYVSKNVNYPNEARRKNIQGTVMMHFYIEKNGTLSNIKSEGETIPYLTDEALRVMSTCQNREWEPAMYEGFVIRSNFRFPIRFKLDKEISPKSPSNHKEVKSSKIK